LTANFNVIKRYNNADAYALAVGHLADRIVGGAAFSRGWPSGNDGLTHAERIELQKHLIKHKYEIGDPDGILGDKSRNAILDVQNRLGLPITGVPSKQLLIELRKYA
jgi:membrane-bound lytic murein transglycosylase B